MTGRRALAVVFAGLAGWIGAGSLLAGAGSAGAQTQTPVAQLGHVLDGEFLPGFRGRDPLFILSIGSDARPGVCEPVERCLADSIQLIGVNPKQPEASILGFPRDSYVNIPGHGTQKINNALFLGGPELVAETVEALVGVEIDYWFMTSFEGFRRMINAIGGIDVEIPYPMNDAASGAVFDAGPAHLDGVQALALARNRKSTPNGDFSRSENHGRLIVAALAQFKKETRKNPFALFRWLTAGLQHTRTDLSAGEVFELALAAMTLNPERVTNRVIPGGIGMAGSASIVTLGSEADAVFADIADDGVLAPVDTGIE